ncbi:MAG: cystathionine gamma-synthase family protein [Bacteroidota bacterium]|jgi:methionine-gamma-lyase|nr:cystathionine gamma-synthase family protein [Bacteroidota bacterium]
MAEKKKSTASRKMKPESLMMSFGYKPELSEGAVKCPIFQTSTFVFKTAEEGKSFFEVAYGKRALRPKEVTGLIYSRINNPDLEILENRLCLWDEAEDGAVFESGMAAISTTVLELLKPGDLLLHSEPIYGGTDHFFKHILLKFGIHSIGFLPTDTKEDVIKRLKNTGKSDRLAMIFIESPANPTNDLIDMKMCVEIAKQFSTKDKKVLTAIDNTFLGPVFSHPIKLGFDLVLYSATKYIGGHSDVIAGACVGSKELMKRIKSFRSIMGTMAGPWTGWLLLRSLETLKMRMTLQAQNAEKIAVWLNKHPKVEKVYYPGLIKKTDRQYAIYKRQCLSPGAMISFDVKGGEKQAFKVLNSLKLIKLAVSLGSTESLAEHPYSMTHAPVNDELKVKMNLTEKMVRLSVGVENYEDIIFDIDQALSKI